MENDNPCKRDCPDRNATCHTTCERYKEWLKEYQEKLSKREKMPELKKYFYDKAGVRKRMGQK